METKTMEKKSKLALPVKSMVLVALFAALLCVCSWISVPSPFTPGVSFTLQTFAVILAGLLLTPYEALLSGVVYILLGLVGLPVCAGFTTLYSKAFTPAGGYFIGFLITPFLIAVSRKYLFKAASKFISNQTAAKTLTFIFAAVVIGILGVDIPGFIVGKAMTHMAMKPALIAFALSFMPTDIIKCLLAAFIGLSVDGAVNKSR
jgi:biotin transport system substrate-specific component